MGRQKFKVESCTKDFTPLQRSQLSSDVWKFLRQDVGGTLNAVYSLTPGKIKEAAYGFIDGTVGRSYWPMSEMDQWECDAPLQEVAAYVADLMARQRKEHTEDDPSFMVDFDPQLAKKTTSVKTPKTADRTSIMGSNQSKLNFSNKKASPVVTNSAAKRQPKSTTASFSQDSYQPEPSREKSPTEAPDIPYREETIQKSPPLQTPSKRSIRPTEASRRIALGKAPSPDLRAVIDDLDVDGDTIVVDAPARPGVGLGITAFARAKRAAEELDQAGQRPPTPQTPSRHPNKRNRIAVQRSSTPPQQNEEADAAPTSAPTSLTSEPPVVPPAAPPQPATPAPSVENPNLAGDAEPAGTIFRTRNLEFTYEKLITIPDVLLNYIEECEDENTRTANASKSEERRKHFEDRAKVFLYMHRDLSSRLEGLANDAREKRIVEKSYSLSSSREHGRR